MEPPAESSHDLLVSALTPVGQWRFKHGCQRGWPTLYLFEVNVKIALLVPLLLTTLCGCSSESQDIGTGQFKAEVWADNWFSMAVGEKATKEDSVSITTERSFNAEIFSFDATYPFVLNFVLKDYKENDSGLEYIGTDKQQMGDGGFIAQITDTVTGDVVAASSSSWKCTVIHKAPTNKTCEKDADPAKTCLSVITEEPSDWKTAGYDISGWESAKEYTEADVSPKEGYDEVSWDSSAKLIWTSDLESDNTLLCKVTIAGK